MTKPFSLEDKNKLYRHLIAREAHHVGARADFLLYQLLSLTGIKIQEALDLKWSMFQEGLLVLPDRDILLPDKAIIILEDWRKQWSESEFIFPWRETQKDVEHRFERWAMACHIDDKGYSLESFRTNFEVEMRESGLPEWLIKQQLGE